MRGVVRKGIVGRGVVVIWYKGCVVLCIIRTALYSVLLVCTLSHDASLHTLSHDTSLYTHSVMIPPSTHTQSCLPLHTLTQS